MRDHDEMVAVMNARAVLGAAKGTEAEVGDQADVKDGVREG